MLFLAVRSIVTSMADSLCDRSIFFLGCGPVLGLGAATCSTELAADMVVSDGLRAILFSWCMLPITTTLSDDWCLSDLLYSLVRGFGPNLVSDRDRGSEDLFRVNAMARSDFTSTLSRLIHDRSLLPLLDAEDAERLTRGVSALLVLTDLLILRVRFIRERLYRPTSEITVS